jgi:hypothetical protein
MSAAADIDFTLTRAPVLRGIIAKLTEREIEVRTDDKVSYVENRNGLYDWEDGRLDELPSIVDRLDRALADSINVAIGISWSNDARGGTLLIIPSDHLVSFSPSGSLPGVEGAPGFIAMGVYLDDLLAVFAPLGLVSYELHFGG